MEEKPLVIQQVTNFSRIMSSASGRDKISKIFVYGSKILAYLLSKSDSPERKETIQKIINLGNGFSGGRRVTRFFLSLSSIPAIYDSLIAFFSLPRGNGKGTIWQKVMIILSVFAYVNDFIYYIFDNITWLDDIKAISLDPQRKARWEDLSCKAWLVSVLIYILMDINNYLKIKKLENEKNNINNKDNKNYNNNNNNNKDNINNKKKRIIASFVSNFFDLQLAIWFCFPNWNFPTNKPHFVGVSGVLAALSAGYLIWPRSS